MNQQHAAHADVIVLLIDRATVESANISDPVHSLQALLNTPSLAFQNYSTVELVFTGYDDDPRELYQIPEVREYVRRMHDQFPYWFHVCGKVGAGLLIVFLCLLPVGPSCVKDGEIQTSVDPGLMSNLMLQLYGAANELHARHGLPKSLNDMMTRQAHEYLRTYTQ